MSGLRAFQGSQNGYAGFGSLLSAQLEEDHVMLRKSFEVLDEASLQQPG